jgi:hypothetical protein
MRVHCCIQDAYYGTEQAEYDYGADPSAVGYDWQNDLGYSQPVAVTSSGQVCAYLNHQISVFQA